MRLGLIFAQLMFFSICALFGVTSGYDFFHAKNPNGLQTIRFLIFGGATIFFGFQLLKAFTDPLPTWYTYLSPTPVREKTDMEKRKHIRQHVTAFAIVYVVIMTGLTFFIIGTQMGLPLESMALPLGFGLLVVLLPFYLLYAIRGIYLFRKARTTSHPANLIAKS